MKNQTVKKKQKTKNKPPPEDLLVLYRAIKTGANGVAIAILSKFEDPVDLKYFLEDTDRYVRWWAYNYGNPEKTQLEDSLKRISIVPVYQAIYTAKYGEQTIIPVPERGQIDFFWLLLAQFVHNARDEEVSFVDTAFGLEFVYRNDSDGHIFQSEHHTSGYQNTNFVEERYKRVKRWLKQWFRESIVGKIIVGNDHGSYVYLECTFQRYEDGLRRDIIYRLLQLGLHQLLGLTPTYDEPDNSRVSEIRSECISCDSSDVAFQLEDMPNWIFCRGCAERFSN